MQGGHNNSRLQTHKPQSFTHSSLQFTQADHSTHSSHLVHIEHLPHSQQTWDLPSRISAKIFIYKMHWKQTLKNMTYTALYFLLPLSLPPSLPTSFPSSSYLPPPSLPSYPYPSLHDVDSIRVFAHAAGFSAARRCLRFLVYYFHSSSHEKQFRWHADLTSFPFQCQQSNIDIVSSMYIKWTSHIH